VAEESIVGAVSIIGEKHQEVIGMIPSTYKLTQQNVLLSTDFDQAIPKTTLKVMILSDEDFNEVVRADLQLIK
jgi:hypothetical protein